MIPEILTIITVSFFGISHSFLATQYIKSKFPISQKYYRIFYVLIATFSLLIIEFYIDLLARDPDHINFQPIIAASNEILLVANFLSILGILIVAGSLIQSNPFKFVGLMSENYEKDLKVAFFYRFSRHPMYFGALLLFIPNLFLINNIVYFIKYFGYSLYFVLGAILEERRMSVLFPNYDIMRSRGFLFPWRLSHLQELLSFRNKDLLMSKNIS
jgi:protein-S-isoprenylcysteine O-methyltransferase Ste14